MTWTPPAISPSRTAPGALSQVRFRAETTDLEVTRQLCRGDTQMLATFGVRYAQLDQSSGLTVNQFANAGADYYSGSVLDHQGFHGTGLDGLRRRAS